MISRINTRPVHVGNVQIGGQDKVVIQSMCNIKTSRITEVANQINDATALGAEIMRLAVLDTEDAKAIGEIKNLFPFPWWPIFILIIAWRWRRWMPVWMQSD